MGQCSTLPADVHQHDGGNASGGGANVVSSSPMTNISQQQGHSRNNGRNRSINYEHSSTQHHSHYAQGNGDGAVEQKEQRDATGSTHGSRLGDEDAQRHEDAHMSDANHDPATVSSTKNSSENPTTPMRSSHQREQSNTGDMNKFLNVVRNGVNAFEPFVNNDENSYPNATANRDAMNVEGEAGEKENVQQNQKHSHHNAGYNANSNKGKKSSTTIAVSTNAPPSLNTPRRRAKEEIPPPEEPPFPSPPEGAVRSRCYRLNLDAPVILSPTHDHFGPMSYDPPPHLLPSSRTFSRRKVHSWHCATDAMMALQVSKSHSADEDPSVDSSAAGATSSTQVAISTARIFRGITVDKKGTIISQNARASRSSRNKERAAKQGEKSRQAAKIDKAKDLVDEAANGSGKENDKDKSNMISLVVIGEYDDMKQLVRDGAKKLRDAEGLPDDALLSLNRPRQRSNSYTHSNDYFLNHPGNHNHPFTSPLSPSSRKRLSPHSPHNNLNGNTPVDATTYSPARSRSRNRVQLSNPNIPQSAPPKLKGHPRDRPSSRRLASSNNNDNQQRSSSFNRFPSVEKGCNNISLFGGGDSDWSDALNFSKGFNSIWNCGATGTNPSTMSPTTVKSPANNNLGDGTSDNGRMMGGMNSPTKVQFEGRNEASARFSRGGDAAKRDAPGGKDVVIL